MRFPEFDDRCRKWVKGYSGTYWEPGEASGCGDPDHCAVHWRESESDGYNVECSKCHKVVDFVYEHSQVAVHFDETLERVVADPGALCSDCESGCEE